MRKKVVEALAQAQAEKDFDGQQKNDYIDWADEVIFIIIMISIFIVIDIIIIIFI